MLTTNQKGAVAEAAVAHAALELGIGVFRPYADERYDLIFDARPRLIRVQCKWAVRHGDVVVVRCYTSRRSADSLVRGFYSAGEIDAFAAYCADVRTCYFLPFDRFTGHRVIQLRLSPTRNNQALGINWAQDFTFAAKLRPQLGAVAQLGER